VRNDTTPCARLTRYYNNNVKKFISIHWLWTKNDRNKTTNIKSVDEIAANIVRIDMENYWAVAIHTSLHWQINMMMMWMMMMTMKSSRYMLAAYNCLRLEIQKMKLKYGGLTTCLKCDRSVIIQC
jgi:hypothetical protein